MTTATPTMAGKTENWQEKKVRRDATRFWCCCAKFSLDAK